MKKILMILFSVTLLVACGRTPKDNETNGNENKEKEISISELDKQLSINDFTYFSGEYKNNQGDTFILQKDGNRIDWPERSLLPEELDIPDYSRSKYTGKDLYVWKIEDTSTGLGYVGIIYPIGVEVPELETDTSKIRISYGHDSPIDIKEVYYKVD